jgi:UDP-N-acetylglucosamine 2-epimerase (non-hydrolysing)
MLKLALVVGARPNFMKIAPILSELNRHPEEFQSFLVHTGQHYDAKMSDVFFDDLGLPTPDVFLGVGSGSHAVQTAQTMVHLREYCLSTVPIGSSWWEM